MPKKKTKKSPKKRLGKGVHIRLTDSIDKRKTILESALSSANLLQKYEDFKVIRNEKEKQRALFKKIIKEIKLLAKELEYEDLPTAKLPKQESKKQIMKEIKQELKLEKAIPRTRLEHDLEDIRDKLENLKI